jgi:F-type H+-transporting ATPase subunit b
LKANAEKRFAEYEGRLKSIDRERRELIASLKEGGELEKRRLVETARRQAEMLRDTQQKFISQELRKAKEELKKEAVVIAAELAEKLLRENLTPEDQNRLVGQYVERMEKLA